MRMLNQLQPPNDRSPYYRNFFTGFVRICYMSLSSDLCDVFLRIYITAFAQTGLNFVFYLHFYMWGYAGWGDKEPRTMTPIPGWLIPYSVTNISRLCWWTNSN